MNLEKKKGMTRKVLREEEEEEGLRDGERVTWGRGGHLAPTVLGNSI